MDRPDEPALRPGVRVRHVTTGRRGVIVEPPRGQTVQLGYEWADFGDGPEEAPVRLLEILPAAV